MKVSNVKTLGSMSAKDIVAKYQSAEVGHFDGSKRKLLHTNEETMFPEGETIASVSDLDGNIVTVNSTFVYMSGYSRSELVGMPHHILRHPDMPKSAFEGLWESLENTGEWTGYVKNLRKDGGYYWTYASIFSLTRNGKLVGYTSVRSEASRDKVKSYDELYRKLLEKERR